MDAIQGFVGQLLARLLLCHRRPLLVGQLCLMLTDEADAGTEETDVPGELDEQHEQRDSGKRPIDGIVAGEPHL